MRQFDVEFEYTEKTWLASCNEVCTTLGGSNFDTLLARMKVVIQDIAEVEMGHTGDIRLNIKISDMVEEIKAAG